MMCARFLKHEHGRTAALYRFAENAFNRLHAYLRRLPCAGCCAINS